MPSKKYQDRGMWLYTGATGRLKEIQEEARKRGLQPSKYLMAAEEAYRQESTRPKTLSADFLALQAENRRLSQELHSKDLMIAQQESELRRLRGAAFLDSSWDADIDSDLLQVLRSGPIHDHRLLEALGAQNPEAMRAISKQLQILETTGFIKRTTKGWCWQE